jgi:anaerobic magnesium-protoporphyrin IX monomethyl ester cyclase
MKYALVNPSWNFDGSTYFGCQETHVPLELFYAQQQLRRAGHETLLIDTHLEGLTPADTKRRLAAFDPDFLVITTTNSYLFWRCPQPELRVPAQWFGELRGRAISVAIGPHSSATPATALRKLACDVVMRGEPDLTLGQLADRDWNQIEGCCWREGEQFHIDPRLASVPMESLGALDFTDYPLHLRRHRHHVFTGEGRGFELEMSRGCPWNCNFCNKQLFRNKFRERSTQEVLREIEMLVSKGFNYIYFIDEIFGCGKRTRALLEGLAALPVTIGMQTRIDLWDEESLEWLGRAHCISMECGIESITPEGRERFRKNCRISTERISELLRFARRHIPWVQANLIAADEDDLEAIETWRNGLVRDGVWVSKPVPMYPFPGTPMFTAMFGPPGDDAWELAHEHYLGINNQRRYYSDIQAAEPLSLVQLEGAGDRR